ncbi:hypothetical protein LXM94_20440 [Rhizobium sp. TRM95111]|uniref:hypothetical protein n=1 Tax=Rhizobium alarense TaxID=2846851 RepID=UPI001F42160D|nr:hypothetical protein [Rhizobium alarense]MCF3642344.1 hypothetical protein [Rhizobium alarense]
MARKKSRIEAFLSFSRHRKRWGAGRYSALAGDLEPLKHRLVEPSDRMAKTGHIDSIDEHLANLRIEFSGRPELVYEHGKLVVLIRREFDVAQNYARFRRLWDEEGDFLCANLNLRWLVSAADTFADHDPDMGVRAIGMMVSVFANTVKIYETDRFVFGHTSETPLPARTEDLKANRRDLFEGMRLFLVGSDDTLRNMRWRLEPFFEHGPVGCLARTVYDRMQENPTAFARFRALHHRDRTTWW